MEKRKAAEIIADVFAGNEWEIRDENVKSDDFIDEIRFGVSRFLLCLYIGRCVIL